MARPTVVAFDLMDTVVRDPAPEALLAATGLPMEEILARRDPDVWPRFERGEITEDEYVASHTDIEFDVAAFHRVRRDGYTLLPGMGSLLDELEGRVVRAAATNYPVWVRDLTAGLLAGRFEYVVASHEIGVRKPDPGFYAALCARVGAEPTEIALVDDRGANLRGAAEVGLRTHRFAGVGPLRDWLRVQGIALSSQRSG